MSRFAYFLYSRLMAPAAILLLQSLRPFLKGKIREMIEDKNQGFYQIKKPHSENELALQKPLWIHAASGEVEYARPLIREFKKRSPDIPVIVTYSSPSAKKILSGLQDVDLWACLPWDTELAVTEFIKKWNPRALLFARTDVWPSLAIIAHKHSLPSFLFSSTFADNSSRLRGFTRYLTRHSLDQLTQIHCVSEEDRQNILRLGIKTPILVSGDTRFDQVFHRLANPKTLKNQLIPQPEDFVLIAGSTWPEDEKILIPALQKIQKDRFKVVLAPHEVGLEHLQHIQEQLTTAGLAWCLYSQAESWKAGEVLLIDQIGILAELYTWADIAFIGGSFKKQVHSVMEALAAGLPVMVGPCHRNNREALYYQKKNYSAGMIVQVVHNSDDVTVLVERMRKQHPHFAQIKEEIRSEVERNKNSTVRVLSALEELI